MKYYLVIDVGTSSLRLSILDRELRTVASENKKRTIQPCFDAEEEWTRILELARRVTRDHPDISAIAVSALVGWVGIDAQGNASTPCYTYMNQCEEACSRLQSSYTREELYDACCRRPSPEYAAFQFADLRGRQPELYEKTAVFLSLKDFINWKLSGIAAMDRTSACYTMLYHVKRHAWSRELIQALELDEKKLPPLVSPWDRLGVLRPELRAALGLTTDPVIAAGSADGSTGILGAGGLAGGAAVSVMGTTDVFFAVCGQFRQDRRQAIMVNPHVIPDLWLLGGPMGMYGGTVDWLAGQIAGQPIDALSAQLDQIPPGSEGVSVLSAMAGERTPFWRPEARGTIMGLTKNHGPAHLLRAIMEANGYANRYILESLKESGVPVDHLIAIGGGSKSDPWLQIKADITGMEVWRTQIEEASSAGACMLALLADGVPLSELPGPTPVKVFSPDPQHRARYDVLYPLYLQNHANMCQLYR